jgi:hypothetical protein
MAWPCLRVGVVCSVRSCAQQGIRCTKDDTCQDQADNSHSHCYQHNMILCCAACLQGLYREEFVRVTERAAIACVSCPKGWQTTAKGAASRRQCSSE